MRPERSKTSLALRHGFPIWRDCGTNKADDCDTSSRPSRRKKVAETARFRRGWRSWRWPTSRVFPPPRPSSNAICARKLRERGWDGEGEPPVAALVERYVELGYIDDEAFARAKIGQPAAPRLWRAAGAPGAGRGGGGRGAARARCARARAQTRRAALALARRRRFGPFGDGAADKPLREKQIAAMLRAGHPLDSARQIVDAASATEAEEWAAEADDDEE